MEHVLIKFMAGTELSQMYVLLSEFSVQAQYSLHYSWNAYFQMMSRDNCVNKFVDKNFLI